MCTNPPATVDYETNKRDMYLGELDESFKKFNGALTLTMNSYRDLLTAFDQVAQVFANLAGGCSNEVKEPVFAFRDAMRDTKDKGPFVAFNSDVHSGTIAVLDPVKTELKAVQKSLQDLKSKQKNYDKIRFDLEKKERDYAKKDKPLVGSKSYQKDIVKRDKAKAAYEGKRGQFEEEVHLLQSHTERVLLSSMNNYLHCTSTFSQYVDTTMTRYRTDLDGNNPSSAKKLDRMLGDAQRQSMTPRNKQNSMSGPQDSSNHVKEQPEEIPVPVIAGENDEHAPNPTSDSPIDGFGSTLGEEPEAHNETGSQGSIPNPLVTENDV